MEADYRAVAELMVRAKGCVALTGAGISAESGIATFRDKGGLWEKYDPVLYASIEAFRRDPAKYWLIRGDFIRNYDTYQPNEGHRALAALEELGVVQHVITQNIDGLHRKAGSRQVTELHGSLREINCLRCGRRYIAPRVPEGSPPYCECGGVLKPNTVLFGEQLPPEALETAYRHAAACRVMLLVGTSAVVQPAASLPYLAKQRGASIVEVNPEKAFGDADYHFGQQAGAALPEILAQVRRLI